MNKKDTAITFIIIIFPPIKNIPVRKLKIKIMPYSLIKIKANIPIPYSILNPDTISDSPSAKSNGVRFDSAIQSIVQRKNKGKKVRANQKPCCESEIILFLYVFHKYSEERTTINIHTS